MPFDFTLFAGFICISWIAIDRFGTASNGTGDGAIALIVDRIPKERVEIWLPHNFNNFIWFKLETLLWIYP